MLVSNKICFVCLRKKISGKGIVFNQNSSDSNDIRIYRGIIIGAALIPKIAKETRTNPARIYLPSFPFTFRSENFREIRGILLTIMRDNITVKIASNTGDPVNELKRGELDKCPAITTDITASAFAGVGKPLKVVA